MTNEINAALFLNMAESGYANLENNKESVNSLNVFPVPDGDTGTNMSLTFLSALSELKKSNAKTAAAAAVAVSSGALMGARGNSGVILSQLLRGFSRSVQGKLTLGVEELADALDAARLMAYKAVMKPTEGTILTVAREMAEFAVANRAKYTILEEFCRDIIAHGQAALAKTPDMLPILKEAGVVDAGGAGLLHILSGAFSALCGNAVTKKSDAPKAAEASEEEPAAFTYCTELLLAAKDDTSCEKALIDKLIKLGDCLLVIQDGRIVKIHLHTDEPWTVMKLASAFGEFEKIKIDNIRRQHGEMFSEADEAEISTLSQLEAEPTEKYASEHVKYALIAVAAGEGFSAILKDLGVNYLIAGGQTMNPSTQDFLDVIEHTDAENYILLPNNKNIILAANQAREMSDKNIAVLETKNIPQAVSALVAFNPEGELDENIAQMAEASESVKTGSVTFAVRTTDVEGTHIEKDDFIGILESDIVVCAKDVSECARGLCDKLMNEPAELVTVYYGADISAEDAEELCDYIRDKYPDADVECVSGAQPLYYYIISAE